jgi:hypothetical protein
MVWGVPEKFGWYPHEMFLWCYYSDFIVIGITNHLPLCMLSYLAPK